MELKEIFEVAFAILASLGGAALLLAAFSSWLGNLWAKRMLQNERAKHQESLESVKRELNLLLQKDVTRHHDKLATYKDIIHFICEILRELEAVGLGTKAQVSQSVKDNFSLLRNKAYGYITLVSNQDVMDKYNDLIDYLLPIMFEGRTGEWVEMRIKADAMLNAMRKDLGINEGEVVYRGNL